MFLKRGAFAGIDCTYLGSIGIQRYSDLHQMLESIGFAVQRLQNLQSGKPPLRKSGGSYVGGVTFARDSVYFGAN